MRSTKRSVKKKKASDELAPHYDLDYAKAKPNRFARRKKELMVVALDSDITKTFRTPEAVKAALLALVKVFPAKKRIAAR